MKNICSIECHITGNNPSSKGITMAYAACLYLDTNLKAPLDSGMSRSTISEGLKVGNFTERIFYSHFLFLFRSPRSIWKLVPEHGKATP